MTNLDLSSEAASAGPITETVVFDSPERPNITPAQIIGMIPLVAEFGHAWGIYTMSQAQQDSLSKLVLGGVALFGADAIIRIGRNLARR